MVFRTIPPSQRILTLRLTMCYCRERVQLVKEWRDAVAVFAESVRQLAECKVEEDKFEKLSGQHTHADDCGKCSFQPSATSHRARLLSGGAKSGSCKGLRFPTPAVTEKVYARLDSGERDQCPAPRCRVLPPSLRSQYYQQSAV